MTTVGQYPLYGMQLPSTEPDVDDISEMVLLEAIALHISCIFVVTVGFASALPQN